MRNRYQVRAGVIDRNCFRQAVQKLFLVCLSGAVRVEVGQANEFFQIGPAQQGALQKMGIRVGSVSAANPRNSGVNSGSALR